MLRCSGVFLYVYACSAKRALPSAQHRQLKRGKAMHRRVVLLSDLCAYGQEAVCYVPAAGAAT
jgi:hypothetical protein